MSGVLIVKARKLIAILSVPEWRRSLLVHRVAAGVEHAVVLGQFDGCQMVVDIGANRGQFALAARHGLPQATIFSFEPLAAPGETFQRVFAGDAKVHLHIMAIGEQAGSAAIHVSARDDSSSLLPITATQNRLFPGTAEAGTQTIRVARLADVLSAEDVAQPALLKLDVQGFELPALRGCEDLLDRFAWIYAECSFVELYEGQALADAVIAWLRERGFALAGVYNMAFDGRGKAIQADFLFERVPVKSVA